MLWSYLVETGVAIHFAHRTFKWSNEAPGKAAVYCVVIGFGKFDLWPKRLFDYETPTSDAQELQVNRINPYLIPAPDTLILRRQKPISDIPQMHFGNMPLDGGNLIISTPDEKKQILESDPTNWTFY